MVFMFYCQAITVMQRKVRSKQLKKLFHVRFSLYNVSIKLRDCTYFSTCNQMAFSEIHWFPSIGFLQFLTWKMLQLQATAILYSISVAHRSKGKNKLTKLKGAVLGMGGSGGHRVYYLYEGEANYSLAF